jgi:hypothetical protein
MFAHRSASLAFTLVGLMAIAGVSAVPAFADQPPKASETPKPKKHRTRTALETKTMETKLPTPEQLYQAPLELNMDPLKSALLKSERVVPYLPVISVLPPAAVPTDDQSDKAHLAPLLRENSTTESSGDKGSFIDRHEFGIQLRDHF